MLSIHNADLMHAIQQRDDFATKLSDMRTQLAAYESKAYYIDEAKREAMAFCQQMIQFFQAQLTDRTNIIEEKKQIISHYK